MIARSLIAVALVACCLGASPSVPFLPPNAPPEIVSMSLSSDVVKAGGTLSGYVVASSNVASIEVRVAVYSFNMIKIAPGQFTLSARVPRIPRIWRHAYELVAIARNTRGDQTRRTTEITIR